MWLMRAEAHQSRCDLTNVRNLIIVSIGCIHKGKPLIKLRLYLLPYSSKSSLFLVIDTHHLSFKPHTGGGTLIGQGMGYCYL